MTLLMYERLEICKIDITKRAYDSSINCNATFDSAVSLLKGFAGALNNKFTEPGRTINNVAEQGLISHVNYCTIFLDLVLVQKIE